MVVINTKDILFNSEDSVFSFRVAGVLILNGKILLQRPTNDIGYAYPGGHVNFGETSENALIREFKEEINVDIKPTKLLWIGENFFPWGKRDCHQICLYYLVDLCDASQISLNGSFYVQDKLAEKTWKLEFSWINLSTLKDIELYPENTKMKLINMSDNIEHFVYRENNLND